MKWSFHLFPFNVGDVADAEAEATAIGMEFHVARGRVVGPDWDPEEHFIAHEPVTPIPCYTLFHTAVVFGDVDGDVKADLTYWRPSTGI